METYQKRAGKEDEKYEGCCEVRRGERIAMRAARHEAIDRNRAVLGKLVTLAVPATAPVAATPVAAPPA